MTAHAHAEGAADERELPPVAMLATISLGLVVIGGILMASFVPRRPPLVVPIVLLVAATIVLGVAFVLLSRIERFAFATFWMVYRWALLAYAISAGMIAYAFIRNHTPGGPLTVTLLMLVIFALSVPMTIAYTVARYQDA